MNNKYIGCKIVCDNTFVYDIENSGNNDYPYAIVFKGRTVNTCDEYYLDNCNPDNKKHTTTSICIGNELGERDCANVLKVLQPNELNPYEEQHRKFWSNIEERDNKRAKLSHIIKSYFLNPDESRIGLEIRRDRKNHVSRNPYSDDFKWYAYYY